MKKYRETGRYTICLNYRVLGPSKSNYGRAMDMLIFKPYPQVGQKANTPNTPCSLNYTDNTPIYKNIRSSRNRQTLKNARSIVRLSHIFVCLLEDHYNSKHSQLKSNPVVEKSDIQLQVSWMSSATTL